MNIEQKVAWFHSDSNEVFLVPADPRRLYSATVIDAHSRRMIGWAIADHMRTDLIQDASAQITAFAKAHRITWSMGYTVGLLG